MKKLVALLLALVMAVSLAACGGGQENQTEEAKLDKNDSANYLGKWICDSDWVLTINKGGIGNYKTPDNDLPQYGNYGGKVYSLGYDFKYKIKDETMVITIDEDSLTSFELNDDGTELKVVQNGLPQAPADEDLIFKKSE